MTSTIAVWVALVAVFAILALWLIPRLQARSIAKKDRLVTPKDLFDSENQARTTLAQILGGAAILTTLVFNLISLRDSREQIRTSQNLAKTAQDQVAAQREGQITDRFFKAVEELGAGDASGKKIEVRQGAIYALERLAQDSERDYSPVVEILGSYVRDNAGHKRPNCAVGPDVQTAMSVLGRRKDPQSLKFTLSLSTATRQIKLYGIDLSCAQLQDADLENVDLRDASLDYVELDGAHLGFAWLNGASLVQPHLRNADLKWADLRDTKGVTTTEISQAANWALAFYSDRLRAELGLPSDHNERITLAVKNFDGYPLANAQLQWVLLEHASFRGAILIRADLRHADLRHADLRHADLDGAQLNDTRLEGADLTDTRVSPAQLQSACTDPSTKLPPALVNLPGRHTCTETDNSSTLKAASAR